MSVYGKFASELRPLLRQLNRTDVGNVDEPWKLLLKTLQDHSVGLAVGQYIFSIKRYSTAADGAHSFEVPSDFDLVLGAECDQETALWFNCKNGPPLFPEVSVGPTRTEFAHPVLVPVLRNHGLCCSVRTADSSADLPEIRFTVGTLSDEVHALAIAFWESSQPRYEFLAKLGPPTAGPPAPATGAESFFYPPPSGSFSDPFPGTPEYAERRRERPDNMFYLADPSTAVPTTALPHGTFTYRGPPP